MDEQTQELVMVQSDIQPQVEEGSRTVSPFVWIVLGLGVFVVLGGIVFFIVRSQLISSSFSNPASSQVIPAVKTVDFSPDVPLSQKVSLLIEKNDSSMEKVLIQSGLVAGYVKNLPPGYRVVSQNSAE